ncbi:8985_t:CDS:2 [Funneliformis geosporum]|uniref:8985_t:CDS:1 n=1 Tax=Funneliformis geosporum TaxID=1117311 RepID=A0A9W4X120_9GLOM|nr:8985_t:CDS:2 [Funneliformis geosporum]
MTSNNDKRMKSLSQVITEELAKKMEKALLKVLEMAICQNFKESSKFVRDHLTYLKKLRLAENPNGYANYIARKLVPDEISYNTRLEKIQAYLYYEISQEEKCEIFKDNAKGIIQELLNMSLTDD